VAYLPFTGKEVLGKRQFFKSITSKEKREHLSTIWKQKTSSKPDVDHFSRDQQIRYAVTPDAQLKVFLNVRKGRSSKITIDKVDLVDKAPQFWDKFTDPSNLPIKVYYLNTKVGQEQAQESNILEFYSSASIKSHIVPLILFHSWSSCVIGSEIESISPTSIPKQITSTFVDILV
jgi:hypothetical protein